MSEALKFRQYRFCQKADGSSIEIDRGDREVECLAFDTSVRRLVSLHVMLEPAEDPGNFHERALEAQEISSPHHAQILQWGDDDDMSFYVTRFIDGATIPQYIRHLGHIPRSMLINLVRQIATLVQAAEERLHLLPSLSLDHMRIVEVQGGALRVINTRYHLGGAGAAATVINDAEGLSWVTEACNTVRKHLSGDLEELLDGRDTLMLLENMLGRGDGADVEELRKLGAAIEAMFPDLPEQMVTQDLLPPKTLLSEISAPHGENAVEDHEIKLERGRLGFAYAYAARQISTGERSYLQLLPGADILPEELVSGIQQSLDRVFRGGLPSRLLTLRPQVGDGRMPFFSEQVPNGFDLETSLASRGALSLTEVSQVLHEIEHSLEQISGSRLLLPRLLPRDVFIVFDNPKSFEEVEALQATALEDLPPFTVRIRAHPTSEVLADGWSFLPSVGGATARSTANDQGRFASMWAAQYFANLTFRLLGFKDGATEGDVRSREFPRALERLLLDCLPGKFRARPPIPSARLAERFTAAVSVADQAAAGEKKENFRSLAQESPQPLQDSVGAEKKVEASDVVELSSKQIAQPASSGGEAGTQKGAGQNPQVAASLLNPQPEIPEDQPQMGFAEALLGQHRSDQPSVGGDRLMATQGLHGSAVAIIREQRRRSITRFFLWVLGLLVLFAILYGVFKSGILWRAPAEVPEWIGADTAERAAPPEPAAPAQATVVDEPTPSGEVLAVSPEALNEEDLQPPKAEVIAPGSNLSVPKPGALPIQ